MGTTLKDIADHLNLSVSTVSRGLNGKGRMSKEVREKIRDTAEKLNYQPNEIARELKMQRSFTIGVIIPDVSNEFYSRLLKSIDQELWNIGYSIIICDTDEKTEREQHYFELLKAKKVSGMIISPVGKSDIYDQSSEEELKTCVFLDNEPGIQEGKYAFIGIDNRKAAKELTEQLLDAGHTEIAIVVGDLTETTCSERLAGYREALKERAITPKEEWVFVGNCRFESGYEAMKKLAAMENRPTAVLAHNNVEAYGVMVAAKECGIRIPEEISLVCFDDFTRRELMEPELTCIQQPIEAMGKAAVKCILRNMAQEKEGSSEKLYMPYRLRLGNSIKKR